MWNDFKYRCLTCKKSKILSTGFYFCNKCAIEYELADENGKFRKPTEWPDWARELYNDEIRRRRLFKKVYFYEVKYYDESIY